MRDVLQQLVDDLTQGRERIVCQVVETRGSTPQKAGALMVLDDRGGQVGTLGGGCVEHEVRQAAVQRLGRPGAERFEYVLDHDYAWADGLICGGKMVILAESFQGPEAAEFWTHRLQLDQHGRGLVETVVVEPSHQTAGESSSPPSPLGARVVFDPDGRVVAGWNHSDELIQRLRPHWIDLDHRPRPFVAGGASWMPVLPRVKLVIVGAGHVGQAVADLAARCDFEVWVVDDREQYANPQRFPQASRILVGPIEEILPTLEYNAHTYALIVTRGHGHDQEALFHLAPTAAGYVGLIGSQRKIQLIFEGLHDLGIAPEALERVTAPIGLEIGSQTVPEIAVSVVAQLIQRRNLGTHARNKVRLARAASQAEAQT